MSTWPGPRSLRTAPARGAAAFGLLLLLALALAPRQPAAAGAAAGAGDPQALGYLSVEEVAADLRRLQARYPHLIDLVHAGQSWETAAHLADRPIWAVRLHGPNAPAGQRPSLALVGGQHAREAATVELLRQFAHHLAGRYGSDPAITYWLDTRDVWIIPLSNPDGYARVYDGALNWRKNTNPSQNDPEDAELFLPNGIGVDLNRNFDAHWGEGGASRDPGSAVYEGPAPFSEPETQAIRDWLTAVRPNLLLAYHSPLAVVLWPWGHTGDPTPDAALFTALGRRIAAYPGYESGQVADVVGHTMGDIAEWAYGSLGILAFGVELDGGFLPDAATRAAMWGPNREALRYALAVADRPEQAFGPVGDSPTATVTEGTATIDVTFNATTGLVQAAEYRLDSPGTPGQGNPLVAQDGAFDTPTETARATIDLAGDIRTVFIRARASSGDWGPPVVLQVSSARPRAYLPSLSMPLPP